VKLGCAGRKAPRSRRRSSCLPRKQLIRSLLANVSGGLSRTAVHNSTPTNNTMGTVSPRHMAQKAVRNEAFMVWAGSFPLTVELVYGSIPLRRAVTDFAPV